MPSKMIYEKRHKRRNIARELKRKIVRCQYDNHKNTVTIDNMYKAWLACKRNVGWKHEVINFELDALVNVIELYYLVLNKYSEPMELYNFTISERGKMRKIDSTRVRERVIQHLLCDQILVPYMIPTFINTNVASLKGRGVHYSLNLFKRDLCRAYKYYKSNDFYILKIDFKHYFESLSHECLYKLIEQYFTDDIIKAALYRIINSFTTGLGLGSQVCQILAVAYLNKVDHYIKEVLRIKNYGRYMDDSYLIFKTRKDAEDILKILKMKYSEFNIMINTKKTKIIKMKSESMTFLKKRFRICESGKIIIKRDSGSIRRFRNRMKKFETLLIHNEIDIEYVENNYKSYVGNNKDLPYKKIKELEDIYNKVTSQYIA